MKAASKQHPQELPQELEMYNTAYRHLSLSSVRKHNDRLNKVLLNNSKCLHPDKSSIHSLGNPSKSWKSNNVEYSTIHLLGFPNTLNNCRFTDILLSSQYWKTNSQLATLVYNKTQVTIQLTKEQYRMIEIERGITPRSTYIRHLLEDCLTKREDH